MQYFTHDYIDFFKDLSSNNNKEWFHANKKRYESQVKKPFIHFVTDLIIEMKKLDLKIDLEAKKCISRINRDIRFSKDKTPYNLHFNAHITKGNPKIDSFPMIAVRFGGFETGIMSGHFRPSKERLYSIREQIKKDPNMFKKLYSDTAFINHFGDIKGEVNKRIPREFQETFQSEPLIANKQFYYASIQESNFITKENLMEIIIEHWHSSKMMNNFLTKSFPSKSN